MSDQRNESLNVSAKTVEEAIEQGLTQLGLTRDQVDIEVVSEGKRGVFGFGSEEAYVRLTPKPQGLPPAESQPEAGTAPPETAASKAAPAPTVSNEVVLSEADAPDEDKPSSPKERDQRQSVEKIAVDYLSGLLERMGIQARVTTRLGSDLVEANEEPPLVLDITGRDLGILIGRRSETLYALQFMLRLMVSKKLSRWQPIVVDVESYRSRRRHSLRRMATRMAERAVASRERVVLEAMTPYERRIIHIALRDHPTVFTKSIGRDDNRKVTIIPKSS
jgi:spoIIIJ-associated protein